MRFRFLMIPSLTILTLPFSMANALAHTNALQSGAPEGTPENAPARPLSIEDILRQSGAADDAATPANPAATDAPEAPNDRLPEGPEDGPEEAQETVTPDAAMVAGLTPVLTPEDAARYSEIFDLQESGQWQAADRVIAAVTNPILMGYVQHQRYMHPTDYRSSFRELKNWMAYYADHPMADEIYRLAVRRRPRGESPPRRPIPRQWRVAPEETLHPQTEADYAAKGRARLIRIEGRVRYLSKRDEALTALKEIDGHLARRTITEGQYDRMRSWIAASLYYQGYAGRAKTLANASAARSGDSAVLAYWIAGLIAFREGDMDAAYDHFSAQADVPYQDDALRSAAGFWAARSALIAGHGESVGKYLEIAAEFPYTFYGQLALAQLGREHRFDWTPPQVTSDGFQKLTEAVPAVTRAIALAEAGQREAADLELRWANGAIDEGLDYDLLAVATALELPAAQIDIALSGKAAYLEAGLFPVPHYAPEGGFATDRALIYALMRQESKFKTEATSRVGARGLMQLMPRTAAFIAQDRALRSQRGRDRLYDPAFNLKIGQTYVNHLIETSARGDLFDLAVAYNGGPGNLRRWKRAVDIEDPLLFIESIPNPESRDFVEKVLTNLWIYRARLGQPAPSRERVAAGELPLYEALDQLIGASQN